MVNYYSLSNLIIDDILLWDGRIYLGVLGGAGSHALSGMRVWSEGLGFVAKVGQDLPEKHRSQLDRLEVDLSGLTQDQGVETARAWQIFQPDERRIEVFRQQTIQSKKTPSFRQIPSSYLSARGMHLYWDGAVGDLEEQIIWLRKANPAIHIVWEPATSQLHESKAAFQQVLPLVDLFSPNVEEAGEITGEASPLAMLEKLIDWGAPLVALRMGDQGSLVGNRKGQVWKIPTYVNNRVDVTGAGNAYCGGFLVGMCQGQPSQAAACMAAVSASFALEQFGLPSFNAGLAEERQKRLQSILAGVEIIQEGASGSHARGSNPAAANRLKLKHAPDTFSTDFAWQLLEQLANTHAPSQTVRFTRAPVIGELFERFRASSGTFISNYQDSGSPAIYFGPALPKTLIFAHADEISYLVGKQQQDGSWKLIPYCKHLSSVEMPGVGLRYSIEEMCLKTAAQGKICPVKVGEQFEPHFYATEGQLNVGDRVVYHHLASRGQGELVSGSMDNTAGVAACLMAAIALSESNVDAAVGFVFTDEEEGPAEHTVSFARGARRLLRRIPPPKLCILVDGHSNKSSQMGEGALFAEASGNCSGGVTPPHIYSAVARLAEEMQAAGIHLHPNPHPVSRGDEIALIEATPNIVLLGYPSQNRHFDTGPGQVSLTDLVHLAGAVYWLALHQSALQAK